MNPIDNTDSLSTLTNSISKLELDELFPFTKAIMDDANRSTQQDRQFQDDYSAQQNNNPSQEHNKQPYRHNQPSISDEVIKKGELIQNTYKVMSDPISGGMGSVWRVHHMSWGADLAMKRPQPRFFAEAGKASKENFIEECVNWIHLGLYPNIVACYYVRDISGVPSIFSEWMDGGSLRDRIHDGKLYDGSPEEVQERILDIAIQAARGLYYAHVNDIVHQDVKPGNILLSTEWDAKIADFGLAKARANLTLNTSQKQPPTPDQNTPDQNTPDQSILDLNTPDQDNRPTGYTLKYCPLAQSAGAEVEPWMDTYALALTILEMYIGKRPWSVGAEAFTWFRTEYSAYRQAHGVRAEIPESLVPALSDPSEFQNHWDSMKRLADTLVKTYQSVTGSAYPRKEPTSLENRAGTLNNMALSFLDLGREETARRLINEAFENDPHHPDVIYNRGLMRWRNGEITDEEAVNAVKKSVLWTAGTTSASSRRSWSWNAAGVPTRSQSWTKCAPQKLPPLRKRTPPQKLPPLRKPPPLRKRAPPQKRPPPQKPSPPRKPPSSQKLPSSPKSQPSSRRTSGRKCPIRSMAVSRQSLSL